MTESTNARPDSTQPAEGESDESSTPPEPGDRDVEAVGKASRRANAQPADDGEVLHDVYQPL